MRPGRANGPEPSNRLRRAIDAREPALVVASHAMSSDLVDLLGATGVHGVWLEAESGPLDWSDLGDQTRAADLWDMATLVRIPEYAHWWPGRALSLGAHGVVLPQVASVAEAEAFAAAARFAPRGDRGVTMGRRSYGRDDFIAAEADDVVTIVQVEDTERLDDLEQLVAIDGVDVVFIAPNDLAASMGLIGQPGHPDVVAAVRDGLARIAAAGGVAGTSSTPDTMADLVDAGARFLYQSIDGWLRAAAANALDALGGRR